MAGRTLDTLIVNLLFRGDTKDLENATRKFQEVDRKVQTIVRGMQVALVTALGIGGAAFFTGSRIERELLNLQTQLGETEESVEAIKPRLEALSSDTAVPLDRLAAGFFALRSAGLSTEAAMDTLRASAYGVNAGMGDIRDIAYTAGGAVKAYGEDAMSGARATDILLSTVEKGSMIASDLTRGFGELLQVSPELGVEMEQLGAIIAAGTTSSVPANVVMTQLRQILFGLLRPTETAKKQFEQMGISTDELARRVDEDLIGALQWLRREAGDDKEAFSRLFESQEAVGLLFNITGENASDFREALDAIRRSTGLVDKAHQTWAQSGLAQVEKTSNDVKLTLNDLYDNAVVPILQLFGKLHTGIQQFIVVIGGASIASALFGGPSLGKVIAALTIKLVRIQLVNRQLRIMRVVLLRRVIPAVRGFIRSLGRAALAMIRFAGKAIVAGISGVIAFGAAIWAALIPPLVAATAAVVGFTVALLANPIVLIVAGIITAFVGLGVIVYKFRRQILGALKTVWNFIKGNWQEIAGLLLLPILGPFALIATNAFGLRDKLIGVFKGIWNWFRDSPVFGPLIDGATQAIEMIKTLLDWAGKIEGAFSWVKSKLGFGEDEGDPNAPRFGRGGMVPGPTGRPLAAVVHGGEMILPPDVARVMSNLMRGPASTPSALYPVPALAGPTYSTQTMSKASEINIEFSGDIVINAPHGSDPQEIARIVNEEIGERFRDVVHNFDDGILR